MRVQAMMIVVVMDQMVVVSADTTRDVSHNIFPKVGGFSYIG